MRGAALAALVALVALMAPTAALAQYMGNLGDAGRPAHVDEDPADAVAPSPNGTVPPREKALDDLADALETARAIIRAHAGGDYWAPDYPIVDAHIDKDDATLIVEMHRMAKLAGIEHTESELQGALLTEVDIEVTYREFHPGVQVSGEPLRAWLTPETRYYLDNCLPVPRPGHRAACVSYAEYLSKEGTVPRIRYMDRPHLEKLFSDDFESGLSANWISSGDPGWGIGHPNDGPSWYDDPASNVVAEAGSCANTCTLTQRIPIDLSVHRPRELVFRAYADSTLRPGDYLKLQVHNAGAWTTSYRWDATDAPNKWITAGTGLDHIQSGEIRVRFVAKVAGPAGNVAIDDVAIMGSGSSTFDYLPAPGDLPLEKLRPGVLTDDELGRLAGDLAAMYRMAAENEALRSLLPQGIQAAMAPPGAPLDDGILLYDDFGSGLEPNWAMEGDHGWGVGPSDDRLVSSTPMAYGSVAEAISCSGTCTITQRAPVDLSGMAFPYLEFSKYAYAFHPGGYLRAQVHTADRWFTVSEWRYDDGNNGRWTSDRSGLSHLDRGEIRVRFVLKTVSTNEVAAINDVAIGGFAGAALEDYVPFQGDLAPERLGAGELGRIAGDLAALYQMALKSDTMRSHLPQGIQEAMGLEPFEYEYRECYLRSCPEDTLVSHGWDHESYLRSEGLDLTHVCRQKYDSLLEEFRWIDSGTYWGEFLHLCNKWHDGDAVVEAFTRHLEEDVYRLCDLMVAYGWRLGPPGVFYTPPWDAGHADDDAFHDECLPRHGLGEFLSDWRRMGL